MAESRRTAAENKPDKFKQLCVTELTNGQQWLHQESRWACWLEQWGSKIKKKIFLKKLSNVFPLADPITNILLKAGQFKIAKIQQKTKN